MKIRAHRVAGDSACFGDERYGIGFAIACGDGPEAQPGRPMRFRRVSEAADTPMETENQTTTVPAYVWPEPKAEFHSWAYLRHNQRRQEHLASLGLDLAGATVLEVGAGIGDHTSFFLDRGCKVVVTEGRPENFEILRGRFPEMETHLLDMEAPDLKFPTPFEIVYCYGLLYHLSDPVPAVAYMAAQCGRMLLLETCVSFADGDAINPVDEPREAASQAVSGLGCRPNRRWVFDELKKYFPHVYLPVTQPWHEEFPLDWTTPPTDPTLLTRAIYIATRQPISHPLLREEIPQQQRRH